ncbi:MAG TPA: DUF2769 domain-containing protein [Coriobacteriia bacterium]|jgi:hypothetical protein
MQTEMKTVAYNADNVMKCQCTSCPVQGESACAMDKVHAMSGMMEKMRAMMAGGQGMSGMSGGMSGMSEQHGEMMLPSAQDMPGMYCSTGTATCGDLDYTKGCICPTCAVYTDNQLDNTKYCNKGSAAQVG